MNDHHAVFGPLFQAPPAPVPIFRAPEIAPLPPVTVEVEPASPKRRGGRGKRGKDKAAELPSSVEAVDSAAPEAPAVDDGGPGASRTARRRAARKRGSASEEAPAMAQDDAAAPGSDDGEDGAAVTTRKRRKRRRGSEDLEIAVPAADDAQTVLKVRTPRTSSTDKVTALKGSTRLEAKKQRRRTTRDQGRKRQVVSEAEFLARRESVERRMLVRQKDDRIQIGVLEDGILAEHFVSHTHQDSLIGNVYLGKVQNVLPSMEAAFIDIGRGRNAVLYAGEVNWDAAGLEGKPRRIELALKSGDPVLVQVTKDPVGHKGARLTSQVSLPGRFLVYVPGGSMTGISRKLPDNERARLKKILREKLPDSAGVIVRTAAEGASDEELTHDINRLRAQWEQIEALSKAPGTLAPELLYSEPDLSIKVVRDVFNEDFTELVVQGEEAWDTIEAYVTYMAPDLLPRLRKWEGEQDLFAAERVDEQINKALEQKVYLPSGGSLVIDRTEAMTVVDVNTGRFTGSGGNLEETVTKNNLEAAEEITRQLRLRDIGGIIVIDFIDMVLESNRDLVLRRLVECMSRDRTKHQIAEVTSLGLVQMTRKRMGTGLLEVFSAPCEACEGRGSIVYPEPVEHRKPTSNFPEPGITPFKRERRRGPSAGDADQPTPARKAPAEESGPPPAVEKKIPQPLLESVKGRRTESSSPDPTPEPEGDGRVRESPASAVDAAGPKRSAGRGRAGRRPAGESRTSRKAAVQPAPESAPKPEPAPEPAAEEDFVMLGVGLKPRVGNDA